MKHMVLYGSERNGDYLIVAIKKSQRDPFSGRHDCRLTTACTNEKHRNKWVRAHGRLSPPYLCVKPKPSKPISLRERDSNTQNLFPLWHSKRCMIVKYWFRKPKDVLFCTAVRWKNRGIMVWNRECGDKRARAQMEMLAIMKKAKNKVFQPQYAHCFTSTTSLPQTMIVISSTTTWQQSNTPNKRTVNSPTVSNALTSQSSEFLDIC